MNSPKPIAKTHRQIQNLAKSLAFVEYCYRRERIRSQRRTDFPTKNVFPALVDGHLVDEAWTISENANSAISELLGTLGSFRLTGPTAEKQVRRMKTLVHESLPRIIHEQLIASKL